MLNRLLKAKIIHMIIISALCVIVGLLLSIYLLLNDSKDGIPDANADTTYSGHSCTDGDYPEKHQISLPNATYTSQFLPGNNNTCYAVYRITSGSFDVVNRLPTPLTIRYSIVGGGGSGSAWQGNYFGGGGGGGGVILNQTYNLAANATFPGNVIGGGGCCKQNGGDTVLFGQTAGGGGRGGEGNSGSNQATDGNANNGSGGGGGDEDDNDGNRRQWSNVGTRSGNGNGTGGNGAHGKVCRECNGSNPSPGYSFTGDPDDDQNIHLAGGGGGAGGDAPGVSGIGWAQGGDGVLVSALWTSLGITPIGFDDYWGGGGGGGAGFLHTNKTAANLYAVPGAEHLGEGGIGGGGYGGICQDDDSDDCDDRGWGSGNGGLTRHPPSSGQNCTGGGGGGGTDWRGDFGSGGSGCAILIFDMKVDADIQFTLTDGTIPSGFNFANIIYGSVQHYFPGTGNSVNDITRTITFRNVGGTVAKNVQRPTTNSSYLTINNCKTSSNTEQSFPILTLNPNAYFTCKITPSPRSGSVKKGKGDVTENVSILYDASTLMANQKTTTVPYKYQILSPELTFKAESQYTGTVGIGTPAVSGNETTPPTELGRTIYYRSANANTPVSTMTLSLPRDYTHTERLSARVRLNATNTAVSGAGKYGYTAKSTVQFTDPRTSGADPDLSDRQFFELGSNQEFPSDGGSNSCSYGDIAMDNATKYCYLMPKMDIPAGSYTINLYITEENTRNFLASNDPAKPQYYVHTDDASVGKITINFNVAESKLKIDPIIFEDQLMGYTGDRIPTVPIKISNTAPNPVYNPQILAIVNTNNVNFIFSCTAGTKSGNDYLHPKFLENQTDENHVFTDMLINDNSPNGDIVNFGTPVSPCQIRPKAGLKPGKYWTSVHVLDRMSRTTYVVKFTVIGPDIRISLPSFPVQNIGYTPLEEQPITIRNVGPVGGDLENVLITNSDEFEFHCTGEIASYIGTSGNGTFDGNGNKNTYKLGPDQINTECMIRPVDNLGQGSYVTPVQIDYNDDITREIMMFRVGSSYLSITQPQFDSQDVGYTHADTGEKNIILNNTGNAPITDIEVRLQDACPFELVNPPASHYLTIPANSKDDTTYLIRPKLNLLRGTYNCKISTNYLYGNITLLTVSNISFSVTAPDVVINVDNFGNVDGAYTISQSDPESEFNVHKHPISINNVGDSIAHITDVSISNTDSFIMTCKSNTSVHSVETFRPEEQCSIMPKPYLASGAYMTSIAVTYSSTNGLISTVSGEVSINIMSSDLDFELPIIPDATVGYTVGQDPGELPPIMITITNRGTKSAPITALYIDGEHNEKFDITQNCVGALLQPGQTNSACYISPIEGLIKGTYKPKLTLQSNGKRTSKLVSFTVLAPQLEIATPTFDNAITGYAIISDSNAASEDDVGRINVTNIGDQYATIHITTTNTSEFEITEGVETIPVGQTNSSWKILPKFGLSAGEHSTNLIINYGHGLNMIAKVVFKVVATELKIEVPSFDDEPIGYQTYNDDTNAKPIVVHNIAHIDGSFNITINSNDWTLVPGDANINKNSSNQTWKLRPNANLPSGVHSVQVVVNDDVSGAEFRQLTTFTVNAPKLVITQPVFDTLEQGYSSILSTPADGVITLNNVGGAIANNVSITATSSDVSGGVVNNANVFVLTNGTNSINRNTIDRSWRIMPKIGLPSGEYYSTITVQYNSLPNSDYYYVTADVYFHITSSKISVQVGDFLPRDVNYTVSEVRPVLVTNSGLNNADVDITINNSNHFNLIGNCSSVLVASHGGTNSGCKIEPKLGLLLGNYTVLVKVTDINTHEYVAEKATFVVKGAQISLLEPRFDDEVINYITYDSDDSAKPLIIQNNGLGDTTVSVRLDSGNSFEIVHDYLATDHNFLGTMLTNPINDNFLIKPKSRLGAGVWNDTIIVTDNNTNDEYFINISFIVKSPNLEILNENFPDAPAGSISSELSQKIRLRNSGDIDATHLSASITCKSTSDDFVFCPADEFSLSNPTQFEVINAPESEWIIAPSHDNVETPWLLSPSPDIRPGTYYVKISIIDLNSQISVDKVLKFIVTGKAFSLSSSEYDDIVIGYDNSEFSRVRIENNSVNEQIQHLSISDSSHFYIGKIKEINTVADNVDEDGNIIGETQSTQAVCDPMLNDDEPMQYSELPTADYVSDVTITLMASSTPNADYCVALKPEQTRGFFATALYAKDLYSGKYTSVDITVKVLAPALNTNDDNPAVRNITIRPEVLSYTDTIKMSMDYNNLGDATGYYSVHILDSKDFELVETNSIEPFYNILSTRLGRGLRAQGVEKLKADVDPMSFDNSISVRPKIGLNPGTYFATLCVSYAAYEEALEDQNIRQNVNDKTCSSTGLERRGIVSFTKTVSFVVQAPRYEITPVRFDIHRTDVDSSVIDPSVGDAYQNDQDTSGGVVGQPDMSVGYKPITIENTGNAKAKITHVYTKTDAFSIVSGNKTIDTGQIDKTWQVIPNRAERASSYVDTLTFVDETGVTSSVPIVFGYDDRKLDDLASLFNQLPAEDYRDLLNVYDDSDFFRNNASMHDNLTNGELDFLGSLASLGTSFINSLGLFPWWWIIILLLLLAAIIIFVITRHRYFKRHMEELQLEVQQEQNDYFESGVTADERDEGGGAEETIT